MNNEEKKPVAKLSKEIQKWLIARPHTTLGSFATLPNHAIMSFVLQFLSDIELIKIRLTSNSINIIIKKYNETPGGIKNIENFLMEHLKKIAKKQNIIVPDTALTVNHVVENLGSSLDQKQTAIITHAHTRKASIYEIVLFCIIMAAAVIGGGNANPVSCSDAVLRGRLPRWAVNLLRVIFAGAFAGSTYGLNYSIHSGSDSDAVKADAFFIMIATLTGVALLADGVQSVHTCHQERKITGVKAQISTLQRRTAGYGSVQDDKSSTGETPYVRLEEKPETDEERQSAFSRKNG